MTITILTHLSALLAVLSVIVFAIGEAMGRTDTRSENTERVSVTRRVPSPRESYLLSLMFSAAKTRDAIENAATEQATMRNAETVVLNRAAKLSSARFCFASPRIATPAQREVNVWAERDAMRSDAIEQGLSKVAATIEAKLSDLDAARKASDAMVQSARAYAALATRAPIVTAEWSDALTVLPVTSKASGFAAMQCGNVAMTRREVGLDANGRRVYQYQLVY